MVLQCNVDVKVNPSRGNVYPSKFKRRRVSAVRDYPLRCGVLDSTLDLRKGREEIVNEDASCPVLRMYPLPKIRKRVLVKWDLPSKPNDPDATNVCDTHTSINSEEDDVEKSDLSIVVWDQQRALDVPPSNDIHPSTDIMEYKPSNVPNTNDVRRSHECIKSKKEGVEEIISLVNVKDEQRGVVIPIANYVNASTNVSDSKPPNLLNAIDVRDTHACIKPNKGVEEASSLMNIGDKQCQDGVFSLADYQVALRDEESKNLASLTKEAILSIVVADERCSDSIFGAHDLQATFKDDEDCLKVHDSEEAFNDNEESLKITLADLSSSQVGPSNDQVIVNNELGNDRDMVKEIINLFREVYNKLLQDNNGKPKGGHSSEAASILLKQHKWIKKDKHFGPVSGVEVGDYFDWRAELSIIGLHCRNIRGIDYMKLNGKNLAISVVDSGRYDNVFKSNDGEFSETLIYSGEGENPKVRSKKSTDDQKPIGGNLALKNSVEAKTPIRVIRKIFFNRGKIRNRKYVYDGLYFVDSYRQEMASSGKLTFKFLLKRFPGQPKLDWKELISKLVCKNDISQGEEREPICVVNALEDEKPLVDNCVADDISQGKERIPIRAMNALDNEKPPIFNYATNVTYPESCHPSMIDDGCDCTDGCSDSEDCPCIVKSGGLTYNYEELLMKAKPLIVECGPSCKCFTSCLNRVSQRGICLPLEVFKTKTKGWGVRSRSSIPRGSFICEYTGEILRDIEGEQRIGKDEYLFDIGVSGDDHSCQDSNPLFSSEGNESFTIDAAFVGNVGRFINHSCSPNLFAQDVLFDHDNKRMLHVMLFAKKVIPPLEELTYHYNYNVGGVCDANGNIKCKPCYCGSSKCTGRMY